MAVDTRQLNIAITTLNAKFNEIFTAHTPTGMQSLYMTQPSGGASETYEFFGSVPQMTEWVDEIQGAEVIAGSYTLLNKDWGSFIKVRKSLINDNRLAQATPNVAKMARRAATWQVPNIRKLLAAASGTTLGVCFDGKALIAADHQSGKSGALTNIVTGTGITYDKISDDWNAALVLAATWLDDQGEPMEIEEDYFDTAIVPPNGAMRKAFQTLVQGKQPLGSPDMSGMIRRVIVDPSLADTNDWYAVSTSGEFRPFLYQEREAPHTATETSEKSLFIDMIVKARGAFGFGDWKTIVKVTNS